MNEHKEKAAKGNKKTTKLEYFGHKIREGNMEELFATRKNRGH